MIEKKIGKVAFTIKTKLVCDILFITKRDASEKQIMPMAKWIVKSRSNLWYRFQNQ